MSSTTTSISSGKRTGSGGGGGGGITMPQVNPHWARLPLFNRKNWTRVRFGDVVENLNETCEPEAAGLERFIGLEHLEPGSLHIRAWGNVADGTTFTRRCRSGQVLFGKRRAYQRKVAVAEFDAVVSGDIYVLAPQGDRLLPELLPFLCLSERFFQHAVGTSAGSLSPRTNWSSLASFEFDLPPLDQQRRFAEILWAVDAAERSYGSLEEDLRNAQRSLERDLFRQRGMRKEKISDVASIQRGRFTPRPRDDPKYFGGAMPFIQTAQVIASRLWVDSYDQTLNDLGVSVSKVFPKDTIVMVIAGTYVGSVAKLAFESAFTDSLLGIHAKSAILENDYLFYYLRHFEAQVDSLATEVAQRNLSITGLQDFEVTFPKDLKEQRKIVSEIERFERICEEAKTVLAQIKCLQQSLIYQIYPPK
ncbi:MAG: restriction endonuclease subunit S [Verrucomicrobia bacterium]|jgi:type I restriction enzyme S subunit|nr:restriction endonuclease subunit S [Verrucomicrobiota bacterium]